MSITDLWFSGTPADISQLAESLKSGNNTNYFTALDREVLTAMVSKGGR